MEFAIGDVLYENRLASEADIEGWRLEGDAAVSFPQGKMRLENLRDPGEGQAANYVFWCDRKFEDGIAASWLFRPIREPGLAMFWFAADGRDGKDLFDPSLATRAGEYQQYFDSDINALHGSYFRRKHPTERAFTTCNLRKSKGFHLVCQGADPIPSVIDVDRDYRIEVVKVGPWVRFSVGGLVSYEWHDNGGETGPVLGGGYIGFRQMAPLIADYSELTVREARAKG